MTYFRLVFCLFFGGEFGKNPESQNQIEDRPLALRGTELPWNVENETPLMNTKSALFGFFVLLSHLTRFPAPTFTVTYLNDSGAGSLKQAIVAAKANPGAVQPYWRGPQDMGRTRNQARSANNERQDL
jgi:hypothetical protein